MRVPLITLIIIFAVSVLGPTLIPGQDAAGQPRRMGTRSPMRSGSGS
jgi:hypothetical protein